MKRKWLAVVLTAAALLASLLITFGPRLGLPVPGWDSIYTVAGLRKDLSESGGQIHFIDVGQADCTLLTAGGGVVLVDGGNNADGPAVVRYLRNLGVERIDYIVATHHHEDHIGGLDNVIRAFPVGGILLGKSDGKTITRTYEDLLTAIDEKQIPVIRPEPGARYEAGEVRFTVLGPKGDYPNENDRSILIRANCGGASVLLAGDAESEGIAELLALPDIRADILKAVHHGSSTSNPKELLSRVSPSYIVIPVGENNSYGHPSASVLELYETGKIPFYRTDTDGSVVFTVEESGIRIQTDAGKVG